MTRVNKFRVTIRFEDMKVFDGKSDKFANIMHKLKDFGKKFD